MHFQFRTFISVSGLLSKNNMYVNFLLNHKVSLKSENKRKRKKVRIQSPDHCIPGWLSKRRLFLAFPNLMVCLIYIERDFIPFELVQV